MSENRPPCLYLLWPRWKRDVPEPLVPAGYWLRPYHEGDDEQLLALQRGDGETMGDDDWRHYLDIVLPNGLFVVEHEATATLVATAGAVHNPSPGRYHFPFGGELGYLIVEQAHRRRGLGGAVCASVVRRFLSAEYESIRVCVQEHRAPAIRTYVGLGFEPFLHAPDVEQRWRRICDDLEIPFTPELWPR